MAASALVHAFLEFFKPVLHTMFFPSHLLISHITIVETEDSGEKGMNPVAMTYHQSSGKILTKLGIEPATSCSQVRNATNWGSAATYFEIYP